MCGLEKSVEDYYFKTPLKPKARFSYCKDCSKLRAREYYESRVGDPEYHKKRYDNTAKRRVAKYTAAERERLFVAQDGKCAVCGIPESECGKRLAVDHCHDSGRLRGLLCNRCNLGIGLLGDDFESLLRAIYYLQAEF